MEVPGRVNQPDEFTQAWLRHVHVGCCHACGFELRYMIQSEENSLNLKKSSLLWFQNKCFSASKPPTYTVLSSPFYMCSTKNNSCLYQNISTWDWVLSLPSLPQLFSVSVFSQETQWKPSNISFLFLSTDLDASGTSVSIWENHCGQPFLPCWVSGGKCVKLDRITEFTVCIMIFSTKLTTTT